MPNPLPNLLPFAFDLGCDGRDTDHHGQGRRGKNAQVRPIEHVHPLVRTAKQLERVLKEVEQAPGIVLYTIVKKELIEEIEQRCRALKVPSLHVLEPIMKVFES